MPRHKRLDVSGAVYHVISRGIERRAIYKDVEDRTEFLKRLAVALSETKSVCYGWVLMIVAYLATQKLEASHASVAEYLRVSKSAIIRAARKGEMLDGKYNIEATIK